MEELWGLEAGSGVEGSQLKELSESVGERR